MTDSQKNEKETTTLNGLNITTGDEDQDGLQSHPDNIKLSKERFWVLFLFGASTMINACGWITLAPIFLLVEDLYGATPLMVNMMSYSFMVLYLPMNWPCVYVVEKFGLRWGVIGGIMSTALGLWIRCFLN